MNRYIIKIRGSQDESPLRNKYYTIYKNCGYITLLVAEWPMYDSEYDAIDAAISYIKEKEKEKEVINFELHIFDKYVCEITIDRLSLCKIKA